jgi:hypothetical protein
MVPIQDMRMEMVRLEIGNEMNLIGPRVHDQEVLAATGRRVVKTVSRRRLKIQVPIFSSAELPLA